MDLVKTLAEGPNAMTRMKASKQAKWFALIGDVTTIAPGPVVSVSLLRHLAEVPENHSLLQDFDSPESDPVLDPSGKVDLAKGNVFYAQEECRPRKEIAEGRRPKLAFSLDDRPKVTNRPDHSGDQLKEIFGIEGPVVIVRDFDTAEDQPIGASEIVRFEDGPVFVTRGKACHRVEISINGKKYPVDPGVYSVPDLRRIPNPDIPTEETVSQVVEGKLVALPEASKVKIKGGEVFVSNCPTGGAS